MLTVLEYAFRTVLIGCMFQRVSIRYTDEALVRKKKIWWLYLFMLAKTFLLMAFSAYISFYRPGDIIFQVLYRLLDLVVFLLIVVIYVWMWEGEPLHILLMFIIMDSLSSAFLVVVAFINCLEGRSNILEILGPIHPADVFIPLLIFLLTCMVHPHMKRLAHFLGNLYLPHRKLLWGVFFVFAFVQRFTTPLQYNPENNTTRIVVAQCSLLTVLLACLTLQQVLFHLRSQREEEEFLDMQIQLLRRRAVVTQYSRTRMAETRKIITCQMRELDKMLENRSSDEKEIDAEVLKGYLTELKASEEGETHENDPSGQNGAAYRGRYCRDILTDEVLSQIADSAMAHGNSITISIRNYDSGRIADEDLARILYCLAGTDTGKNTAKKAAGDRELSLTGTDGQMIIRMSADRLRIPRSRIIAMQSVIRKYKGELSFKRSKEGEEAYVILPVQRR